MVRPVVCVCGCAIVFDLVHSALTRFDQLTNLPTRWPGGRIMRRMDPCDIGRVAQVCRLWRDVAETREVRAAVYARFWGINPSNFRPIFDDALDLRAALIVSSYAGPVSRDQWW